MNKKIRKSAAGALLLLMTTLGACGEDRQEAENMTGKDQATEMTGSMSEQDRSMFAGGMATEDPQEPDVNDVVKLCDTYNIPVATNIASAELFIRALENGDLEWREM